MEDRLNHLSHLVIGRAIEVHKELGPGLLESAYEACLEYELQQASLKVERQKPVRLKYKTLELDCGYRLDLLVEGQLVVEVKSVAELMPIFDAQVLTYIRLANVPLGLLMNFNAPVLKNGLKRFIR
ncbi:MAG: GxxExxY protein [Verrucomicrobia bacterium]|nr:GxxExxY protein [Verrucomicrobiota bacterium]